MYTSACSFPSPSVTALFFINIFHNLMLVLCCLKARENSKTYYKEKTLSFPFTLSHFLFLSRSTYLPIYLPCYVSFCLYA